MSETYTPDSLIAGNEFPALTESGTLLAGQNLKRGTVLGAVLIGTATPAAVAGNSGNGTLATVTVSGAAKAGVYRAVCIEPGTDAGKFSVEDPDGVTVGVATAGVAFTGGGLTFTIADGTTDFAAGDSFTITVASGSGSLKKVDKTAIDGSQHARYILAADCDATSGAKTCVVYDTGIFNESALILADGTTVADVRAALRSRSIFLRSVQSY